MRLEIADREGMGTGQMVWLMTVCNARESACTLTGYPRLTALGADG